MALKIAHVALAGLNVLVAVLLIAAVAVGIVGPHSVDRPAIVIAALVVACGFLIQPHLVDRVSSR